MHAHRRVVLTYGSVYQDLLAQRLRTSGGDYPNDRTNWVTTAFGPLQRPTYIALFYRTSSHLLRSWS